MGRGAALVLSLLLLLPAPQHVLVPAGARILHEPHPAARLLVLVDEEAELTVLERKGDWIRVRYSDFKGWFHPELAASTPEPGIDSERLERACGLLWDARERTLGPYRFFTDVSDPALLKRLGETAASVAAAYEERYGIAPPPPDGEAVVLFSREADYAAFETDDAAIAGLGSHGSAGRGIALLVTGSRVRDDVAGLLVHELAHLMNRRALGAELPPWLEEGIAEELSYSRLDDAGRPMPATYRMRRSSVELGAAGARRVIRHEISGPQATVNNIVDRARASELPPLAELMRMEWRRFVAPEMRTTTYPESALLIRYLLHGDGGALAPAFRSFLGGIAEGASPSAGALLDELGIDETRLEKGFREWLPRERSWIMASPAP